MTDDALDPRDAVLELLLDPDADPARREELRSLVDRDPAAVAELAEFERVDDLLRTAGPMLEPSDELMARIMAVPDEARTDAEVPWETSMAEHEPSAVDDPYAAELAGPALDGPTLLADLMPPSRRTARPERRERRDRDRGGFLRSVVVWRAATVLAAAAAIVFGVMAFTGDDTTDSPGVSTQAAAPATVTIQPDTAIIGAPIALTAAKGETATANVVNAPVDAADGDRRIRLTMEGLEPGQEVVYTVWIAKNPQRRIALGTYTPDAQGNIDVTLSIPDLPKEFKGIWVTREKPTGTKGWSKDWVAKGSLAQS